MNSPLFYYSKLDKKKEAKFYSISFFFFVNLDFSLAALFL